MKRRWRYRLLVPLLGAVLLAGCDMGAAPTAVPGGSSAPPVVVAPPVSATQPADPPSAPTTQPSSSLPQKPDWIQYLDGVEKLDPHKLEAAVWAAVAWRSKYDCSVQTINLGWTEAQPGYIPGQMSVERAQRGNIWVSNEDPDVRTTVLHAMAHACAGEFRKLPSPLVIDYPAPGAQIESVEGVTVIIHGTEGQQLPVTPLEEALAEYLGGSFPGFAPSPQSTTPQYLALRGLLDVAFPGRHKEIWDRYGLKSDPLGLMARMKGRDLNGQEIGSFLKELELTQGISREP